MRPSDDDSETPRQLRTPGDDEPPLSRAEADVAGITVPVYGEDEMNPNADDQRDAHQ